MTVYQKELLHLLQDKFGQLSTVQLIEKLSSIGVLDCILCKVLVIREFVAALQRSGVKKIDAMWIASEKFACSYEYIRKCMYYYTDVSLG